MRDRMYKIWKEITTKTTKSWLKQKLGENFEWAKKASKSSVKVQC